MILTFKKYLNYIILTYYHVEIHIQKKVQTTPFNNQLHKTNISIKIESQSSHV